MPIFRKKDRSILFIHVPKTGGSTIERLFQSSGFKTSYLDGRVGPNTINHVRKCTPQHMHRDMLAANFRFEAFDAIFMIVREPISRFKSEYVWRNRRGVKADSDSVAEWTETSFRTFSNNEFLYDNHLRPQVDFYIPGSVVYRLEDGFKTLAADLNNRFELGLSEEIPRIRSGHERTGVSSDEVVLDEHTFRRVRDFYREDFLRFGYHLND